MAETIPLRFAQSLLRLAPMDTSTMRAQLMELNLPLVLLQRTAVADAQISVEDYGRLFVHLVHQLQEQLPYAASSPEDARSFSAYRMMYEAMLHSRDLRQALQRAALYFRRLPSGDDRFILEETAESITCEFIFEAADARPLSSPENFNMEKLHWLPGLTGHVLSVVLWHRVCSWFIGCHIDLEHVEMTQAADSQRDGLAAFGMPVQFGAARNAFTFNRRYGSFPIVQSEASLDKLLLTYPADLFSIEVTQRSLAARVRSLIGNNFQRPLPGLGDMAQRLHMTAPTLHRRLKEEGTSYQQLKDDCRRDAAISHLSSGDYTAADLAEMMGFADSSTFHRAFKKWTGMTPQEYRAANT